MWRFQDPTYPQVQMEGLLLINKPSFWTSFDVVKYIKRISTCPPKVGHTGTLDPIAQGLLILCLGKYTKLVPSLMNKEKEYLAGIRLGETRDTDDISGNLIQLSTVNCQLSAVSYKKGAEGICRRNIAGSTNVFCPEGKWHSLI